MTYGPLFEYAMLVWTMTIMITNGFIAWMLYKKFEKEGLFIKEDNERK